MKIALYIISLLLFFYLCIMGYMYLYQRDLLYHPHPEKTPLSYYNIPNASETTLTTEDGIKLQAWFRPADDHSKMVLFLHGNAGNLDDRAEHLQVLTKMGYGFIIPAWRGFGKSQGTPSMDGLYEDARAAIDFIKDRGYKLSNTIIIGESLGTGIATQMATEYKFKGLLLITPYTSIADRASELYPFLFAQYLTKDNFSVIDKINRIDAPLLIIHGTNDNVVPYLHAQKIFESANEPKKFILYPKVNHVNYNKEEVFLEMDRYFNAIAKQTS